jgi:hypothetical protein
VLAVVTEQWLGVLFSLLGWVYIMVNRPYQVGDRVAIEDPKGDVVEVAYETDLDFARTTMRGSPTTSRATRWNSKSRNAPPSTSSRRPRGSDSRSGISSTRGAASGRKKSCTTGSSRRSTSHPTG